MSNREAFEFPPDTPLSSYLIDSVVRSYRGSRDPSTDLYHGIGSLTIPNCFQYDGGFSYGMMHGRGRIQWDAGAFYEGPILRNCITTTNSSSSDSPSLSRSSWTRTHLFAVFSEDNLPPFGVPIPPDTNTDDWGHFEYGDGQGLYVGDFQNGLRHGYGRYVHKFQGSEDCEKCYQGEWENDFRHGRGILYFSPRSFYIGYFEKGFRSGFGIMVYESGNVFEGNWENGMKKGHGTMFWRNECHKYEGDWGGIGGVPNGRGAYVYYNFGRMKIQRNRGNGGGQQQQQQQDQEQDDDDDDDSEEEEEEEEGEDFPPLGALDGDYQDEDDDGSFYTTPTPTPPSDLFGPNATGQRIIEEGEEEEEEDGTQHHDHHHHHNDHDHDHDHESELYRPISGSSDHYPHHPNPPLTPPSSLPLSLHLPTNDENGQFGQGGGEITARSATIVPPSPSVTCNYFEGQFTNGLREGPGCFYYADGSRYIGHWKGNRKNGKGTLIRLNGVIEEIEFAFDKQVGGGGSGGLGGDNDIGIGGGTLIVEKYKGIKSVPLNLDDVLDEMKEVLGGYGFGSSGTGTGTGTDESRRSPSPCRGQQRKNGKEKDELRDMKRVISRNADSLLLIFRKYCLFGVPEEDFFGIRMRISKKHELSKRQLWRFARDCGLVGAHGLTFAQINRIVLKTLRASPRPLPEGEPTLEEMLMGPVHDEDLHVLVFRDFVEVVVRIALVCYMDVHDLSLRNRPLNLRLHSALQKCLEEVTIPNFEAVWSRFSSRVDAFYDRELFAYERVPEYVQSLESIPLLFPGSITSLYEFSDRPSRISQLFVDTCHLDERIFGVSSPKSFVERDRTLSLRQFVAAVEQIGVPPRKGRRRPISRREVLDLLEDRVGRSDVDPSEFLDREMIMQDFAECLSIVGTAWGDSVEYLAWWFDRIGLILKSRI